MSASQTFPDLTVEVRWSETDIARNGRAIIRNGVLAEQPAEERAPGSAGSTWIRAASDGSLELALTCVRWRDAWHGYAIAADEHAFFRVAGSFASCELFAADGVEAEWAERWSVTPDGAAYAELAPREAIAADELRELDRLAREFSSEWIWFDESPPEETAVERRRFADYGYPVKGANLRAEKLLKVLRPQGGALAFASLGKEAGWIPELLGRLWQRAK